MLTPAQLQTLKAFIANDQNMNGQPNTDGGAQIIADLLNAPASPDFFVWRTNVPVSEIMQNGFDWARVDNLTVGKARIWEWMIQTAQLNPSQLNVRQGVIAVFTTAGDLAMRNAIFGHCQRKASVIEKLFATGAGTSTTDQGVGPALMAAEGPISYIEVFQARNL